MGHLMNGKGGKTTVRRRPMVLWEFILHRVAISIKSVAFLTSLEWPGPGFTSLVAPTLLQSIAHPSLHDSYFIHHPLLLHSFSISPVIALHSHVAYLIHQTPVISITSFYCFYLFQLWLLPFPINQLISINTRPGGVGGASI